MESSIDLRYAFPPLTNLLLLFFQPRPIDLHNLRYPILIPTALLVLVVFVLLFLLTSIKLSFNSMKIRFEPGHFSAPVAILLLSSITFQPSHFWAIYSLLTITSPFHAMLFNLLKYFLRRILHSLPSFRPLTIGFAPQDPPPSPAPVLLQPQPVYEIVIHAMHDVNDSTAGQPTESPIQEMEPNYA